MPQLEYDLFLVMMLFSSPLMLYTAFPMTKQFELKRYGQNHRSIGERFRRLSFKIKMSVKAAFSFLTAGQNE